MCWAGSFHLRAVKWCWGAEQEPPGKPMGKGHVGRSQKLKCQQLGMS